MIRYNTIQGGRDKAFGFWLYHTYGGGKNREREGRGEGRGERGGGLGKRAHGTGDRGREERVG